MTYEALAVVTGALLLFMGLAGSLVKRLPLTGSLVYLAVGVALGPFGFGLLDIDPFANAELLERITEFVVVISLFTAGLKLRAPLRGGPWAVPLRLAFGSMALTVGLIAAIGHFLLGLSPGAAILLGAILAPTDPVLASDVQVESPADDDRLRFGLTGEAGLNDGTAFPFVMLGLGVLGLHGLGPGWTSWLAVDVAWAVAGGLAIGAVLGTAVARLTLHVRRTHGEAVGLDDFLALGLVAATYGIALLLSTYGFLAVFAAGLALRRIERVESPEPEDAADPALIEEDQFDAEAPTKPETAPAYMAHAILGFNEQIERIAEVAAVVILGAMFVSADYLPAQALWFVPLVFLVVRPMSVALGLVRSSTSAGDRALFGWFGIRGIGSLYYLMFAIYQGFEGQEAELVTGLVMVTVASSIVVHGVSVTPLMARYRASHKPARQPSHHASPAPGATRES